MQKIGLNKALVSSTAGANLNLLISDTVKELAPKITLDLFRQSIFTHTPKVLDKYRNASFHFIDRRRLHNDIQAAIKSSLKNQHSYFKDRIDSLELVNHGYNHIQIKDIIIKTAIPEPLAIRRKTPGGEVVKPLPEHRRIYALFRYLLRIQLACVNNNIPVSISATLERNTGADVRNLVQAPAEVDTYAIKITLSPAKMRSDIYLANTLPTPGLDVKKYYSQFRELKIKANAEAARFNTVNGLSQFLWDGIQTSETFYLGNLFALETFSGGFSDSGARMSARDSSRIIDLLAHCKKLIGTITPEDEAGLLEELSLYGTPPVTTTFYLSEFGEILSNLFKFNTYDPFESSYIPRKTAAVG